MANRFCPSDAVLMQYALSADDSAVVAHVARCERCRSVLAELGGLAGELRRAGAVAAPAEECVDELVIARVADGGGTAAELAHLAQCAACRADVLAVASATRQGTVAAEIENLERHAANGWGRRVLALGAAAAAIAVTVVLARSPAAAPAAAPAVDAVYRDAPPVATEDPVVVTPADVVASRPIRLVWRPTAEARQYRVTVFDIEGSIVWEGATADTAAAVPSSVPLAEGVAYWWRVEARVGFDRWTQSELASFSVGRAVTP